MKILLSLLVAVALLPAFAAQGGDVVHHPAPKDPLFLMPGLYESLKSRLPSPPAKDSEEQRADEKELFALQKLRTQEQCARAQNEVFVSLQSFFGQPAGILSAAEVERLRSFFDQVRNDGDFFIQKMKIDFPRERPFTYIVKLNPCVPKEVTGAYPSGHATLSRLYALILADIYPSHRLDFAQRANEIGRNRVLSGMHHPSDVRAGQQLAEIIYQELKSSKPYAAAFEKVRSSDTRFRR